MKAKIVDRLINSLKVETKTYEVRDSELKGFSLIVRQTGVMSFCIRYRNQQGKWCKFTIGKYGALTAKQARHIANTKLSEVKTGVDIQAKRTETRKQAALNEAATLGNFLDSHYRSWVTNHLKGAKDDLWTLDRDFAFLFGKNMADITQWDVQKWSTKALKKGLKASSINRRVTTLKSVLSKASAWGIIETNPLTGMKLLKVDNLSQIRYLTPEEETTLRKALDVRQNNHRQDRTNHIQWCKDRGRDIPISLKTVTFTDYLKPLVLLALNTGMRRGELFNLRWVDVDLNKRLLTIRGEGAKSGRTRHIPLNNEAFSILAGWNNQCPAALKSLVFPSPVTGERLNNIKKSWSGLIEMAKLRDFRFHDLRHSFASNLVMNGIDLYTVKELLGHASIEMTQRYAHLSPNHKAAAVATLDINLAN